MNKYVDYSPALYYVANFCLGYNWCWKASQSTLLVNSLLNKSCVRAWIHTHTHTHTHTHNGIELNTYALYIELTCSINAGLWHTCDALLLSHAPTHAHTSSATCSGHYKKMSTHAHTHGCVGQVWCGHVRVCVKFEDEATLCVRWYIRPAGSSARVSHTTTHTRRARLRTRVARSSARVSHTTTHTHGARGWEHV